MGRRRPKKEGQGRQLMLLLVLLGLLGGLGTWNYRRNAAEEAKETRPYRTLSVADLDTLATAYEAEVQQLSSRYERFQRQQAPAGGGDGWSRFEAVQQHSRAVRELGRQLSERQGALEELRREKERRSRDDGLQRFLARVFTVPAI